MWDAENKRWIMYFNEHWMGLAISTDPNGMPGSWSKWNGWTYGYNQPGLGGSFVPLPGLADVPGANPSISWNTYLSKFVMVYSGWDYKLHISASHDGIQWDQVRTLTGSVDWTRAWYPTLMSDNGPYISFKDVAIYYADRFHGWDQRKIVKKTLHFQRYD